MNKWICDDCFNVLPILDDNSVDLVFTSPPDLFDIGTEDRQVYEAFLLKALKAFDRIIKDGGFIAMCQTDRKMKGMVYSKHSVIIQLMESLGFILKDYKIMLVNSMDSKDQYKFSYQHLCVFTRRGTISRKGEWTKQIFNYKLAKSKSTYYIWNENFCKLVINTLSKENDLVVDPFAGSGVVIQAAKELGRQYLGVEMNKETYENSIVSNSII